MNEDFAIQQEYSCNKESVQESDNPDGQADCFCMIDSNPEHDDNAFISFAETVDSAPDGWEIQDNGHRICTEIQGDRDASAVYLQIAQKMCDLMKWIKELPPRSP